MPATCALLTRPRASKSLRASLSNSQRLGRFVGHAPIENQVAPRGQLARLRDKLVRTCQFGHALAGLVGCQNAERLTGSHQQITCQTFMNRAGRRSAIISGELLARSSASRADTTSMDGTSCRRTPDHRSSTARSGLQGSPAHPGVPPPSDLRYRAVCFANRRASPDRTGVAARAGAAPASRRQKRRTKVSPAQRRCPMMSTAPARWRSRVD